MARIPMIVPQVETGALPGARLSNVNPEMSPALAGGLRAQQQQQNLQSDTQVAEQRLRLTDQVSQGLGKLSDEMARQEAEAIAQANQLRVDDAINKAKEAALDLTLNKDTGYSNVKGVASFDRASGKTLADEYTEKLNEQISNIGSTLSNDRQRAAFQMHANDLQTQFRGQVMKHEGQEYQNYAMSVREGTIANRMQEIGVYYNDPARIDDAVLSIKAAVADQGRMLGKSAEWIEAQTRKVTSNAHKVALESAMQNNDVRYADQYLKKYANQMDADDILRVNGLITKDLDAKIAAGVADKVILQAAPKIVTSDADRLTNLVMGAESGGKRFGADGKILTSSAGAKGEMQVMDGTNKNPGFGVKPAQDDSPDERARVGRDYLQAMLREYKGNVSQALAAYNAGPGSVNDALAAAKKAGDEANWMKYLPKPQETIPYVRGIMNAYGTGDGSFRKPTLEDIHAQVRAEVGDSSPQRLKMATDEATRRYNDMEKAAKQRDEETVAETQRALMQNGGKFADLPANLRAAIPPGQVDNLMTFGAKIAKGQPIETDWSLYYKFKTDPALLGATNLAALRDKFGDTEFKSLVGEQQSIRTGKHDSTTALRSSRDVVNQMMREAGIDPTPKDTDTKGAAKVGKIWEAVETRVRDEERTLGRKLRPDEVKKTAASLFTTVSVKGTLWDSDEIAALVKPEDKLFVPQKDRLQIEAALKVAGKPVNDQTIETLYRRAKGVK